MKSAPSQTEITAAAARRRTFAASQRKGSNKGAPPPSQNLQADPNADAAGVVAGLDALSASAPHHKQHAAKLVHAATSHGHHRLASAIRSVSAVPDPGDKMQVAQNYLATVPPDTAASHVHMFTPTLMGRDHG